MSEVDEAEGLFGAEVLEEGGWFEELEVTLLAADEVPLEVEAEAAGAEGVRVLDEVVFGIC